MSRTRSGFAYKEYPILEVAKRCGLMIDSKTMEREEVEASCPFCRDHGPGKHHLSLNTTKNIYRCNLCDARGNSVTLYAWYRGISNKEAAAALDEDCKVYPFPERPRSKPVQEKQPAALPARHDVYYDMLTHLTLSEKHREELRRRGLSDERIEQNMYRTLPQDERARRFVCSILGDFHNLDGVPGFGIEKGAWTLAGHPGLMIPYCDKDGYIQGMQIRLDDEADPQRKYRWLSSRYMDAGTRCPAQIHITGDTSARVAYLTEGGLKGDVASYLDGDALFVCFAGINALGGLPDALQSLALDEAVIALDMDRLTNWRVRKSLGTIKKMLSKAGIKARPLNWNMSFKGVDDFYKARKRAATEGQDMTKIQPNNISDILTALWKKEYPKQDRGFIHACEWEELRVPLGALCSDPPKDEVKARRYLQMLREGTVIFPPLVCINGQVIDGQHRFWAYTQAGHEMVTIYQNKPWQFSAAA